MFHLNSLIIHNATFYSNFSTTYLSNSQSSNFLIYVLIKLKSFIYGFTFNIDFLNFYSALRHFYSKRYIFFTKASTNTFSKYGKAV